MTKVAVSIGSMPILVHENREKTAPSGANEKLSQSLNDCSRALSSFNTKHVKKVETQTILMGPCTINTGYIASTPDILSRVVKCVRLAGWKVKVIPDNFHIDMKFDQSPAKVQKVDREYEYLCLDREYSPLEVRDSGGNIVSYIDTLGDDEEEEPWVRVKCVSQEAVKFMEEHLKVSFSIVQVSHVERKVQFSMQGYYLTASTGGDELRTFFEVKQTGTNIVVAKARCTYQNEATGVAGPTLEHIETVKEWQNQGLGISLLESVMEFYRSMFTRILIANKDVRMYATAVSSSGAFEWFQERGFRDDYGTGEELSISLNEENAAAEAPYLIRKCIGSTPEGTPCPITSESASLEADPLCFGVSKFCLKCQSKNG